LYSATTPPINPKMPEIIDWGSGLNILIFLLCLPVWVGKWMFPYPRTKDLPKKSVPYRATTS